MLRGRHLVQIAVSLSQRKVTLSNITCFQLSSYYSIQLISLLDI